MPWPCNIFVSEQWYVSVFSFDLQADAELQMQRRGFYEQSMKYVLQLQEVQERKKFEFVEIVSSLILIYL